MENIKYQISSIDMNKMDNTFIFLKEEIKKDLINFLNDNLSNYMKEIYSNYNYKIFKDCYKTNEIEQIIINENMEFNYKQKICESLHEYSKNPGLKKIENLSIIITGKSGIGKSTLINCLLKEMVAKEGTGGVETQVTKSYSNTKFPFLKLTDTRGYELNAVNDPEKIKKEVLNTIQSKKEITFLEHFRGIWNYLTGNEDVENKDFKEYYHCIWFCVNGNGIDEREKNVLNKLKENKHNLPLIVVFTLAKRDNEVKSMKNKIKSLYPDLPFIPVLARETNKKSKYGLDDLLNLTLTTIKSSKKNDILEDIINEYKKKEVNNIKNKIIEDEINIINNLAEKFISDYSKALTEEDFESYIYYLIWRFISGFSFMKKISQKTKLLFKENIIKNIIQSYNSFYLQQTQNNLNNILVDKSLEYLDMQVKIEKMKNVSINTINKRDRDEFKQLICQFCKDNFHYIAQKYLIVLLIKDLLEDLSEKLGKNIYGKMKTILSGNELFDNFRNIYLKIFTDFEERINEKRDKDGKIYN